MGRALLLGVGLSFLTMIISALAAAYTIRVTERWLAARSRAATPWDAIWLLEGVTVISLFWHFANIILWGVLFRLLDQFDDLGTAVYHSAVNYATLGYGDIVMAERWRILGPIEAINGGLMFGLNTALLFAVVSAVFRLLRAADDRSSRVL